MKDQRGIAALILIIVGVFVVGGAVAALAYINANQTNISDQVDQAEQQQQAQTSQSYPDLWAQANLPEYPNATIIDKRQGTGLSDGVQVTFNTSASPADVEAYFDSEMSARGFDTPTSPGATELVYFGIYKKANTQLSVTATVNQDSGATKVHASYVEL